VALSRSGQVFTARHAKGPSLPNLHTSFHLRILQRGAGEERQSCQLSACACHRECSPGPSICFLLGWLRSRLGVVSLSSSLSFPCLAAAALGSPRGDEAPPRTLTTHGWGTPRRPRARLPHIPAGQGAFTDSNSVPTGRRGQAHLMFGHDQQPEAGVRGGRRQTPGAGAQHVAHARASPRRYVGIPEGGTNSLFARTISGSRCRRGLRPRAHGGRLPLLLVGLWLASALDVLHGPGLCPRLPRALEAGAWGVPRSTAVQPCRVLRSTSPAWAPGSRRVLFEGLRRVLSEGLRRVLF